MSGPPIFTPAYYERMRDLEAHGWWNAAMRETLAAALGAAALPEMGLLIDVGCGSGETLAWFASRRPKWRWIGIDLAWEGLRALPRMPRGRGIRASALALPVASSSADLVVCQDVLQHLPLNGGDLGALVEMRRVLKPGGLLFLRTNAQSVPRTDDDAEYNFHRYETRELRQKLVTAGFRIEVLGRVNALLGLAEIPRERRAICARGRGYHGLLSTTRRGSVRVARLKQRWLSLEGRLALLGWSLPLGRTHLAVCRVADGVGQ